MTKAKISEYDAVAANNTDVNGVNIAENCPPSGMNNMGREIMAALKRFQTGSDSDGVTVGGNLVVSGTSTLSTTSISSADINAGTIDGTAIGGSTPAAGSFTTLNTSGQVVFNDAGANVDFRVEGDTDANLLFVDASADDVGVGTNTPATKLHVKVGSNGDGLTLQRNSTTAGDYSQIGFKVTTDDSGAPSAWIRGERSSAGAGNDILILGSADSEVTRVSGGFLRMASGSGGIQFNGDTAAANALDDYEEGTFTAAIVGSTVPGTGTYSVQVGNYTKVGNTVSVRIFLVWSAHTGTGDMSISGLPFTSNSNSWSAGAYRILNLSLSANNVFQAGISTSSTTVFLEQYATGGGGSSNVPMDTSAQIMFTTQYIV